jgi:addiction module RelE/StbE family toxin
MKIEWTQSAEQDLRDLYDWIAKDSPANAERFIDRLLDSATLLQDQPLMGREVPEAARVDVREVLIEDYRIFYLVKADYLYVLGLIHGSRDLANMQTKPWD